ncbi:hypothetical protein COO91_04951 [Nostoc flagelliforme CCNUN1]|uniref:Uncharacterized protein n=1 Tax=Nostoc flagelliforme CCNUN1 TaxID=2038116 RepID=A0A2K8SU47_9NOSO|nr:hypothetical protein COO91_04951 [Nostoc flagelliforme CCNUN1]
MVTILAPRWLNLKGENFALVNSQSILDFRQGAPACSVGEPCKIVL